MVTEANTCRKYITPALQAAGWDTEPYSIAEQRTFTDGRILPIEEHVTRLDQKRADYLLRYRRDFTLAVVEAKAEDHEAGKGMQQAKEYAEILGLRFAYATNDLQILEFDNYVVRITSDEGEIGLSHLSNFKDPEHRTPALVTTSKLLTTGVDIPDCRNITLARVVNSMTEFKQIIGRDTRVKADYGKYFLNILDYTGSASERFADPDFDMEGRSGSRTILALWGKEGEAEKRLVAGAALAPFPLPQSRQRTGLKAALLTYSLGAAQGRAGDG